MQAENPALRGSRDLVVGAVNGSQHFKDLLRQKSTNARSFQEHSSFREPGRGTPVLSMNSDKAANSEQSTQPLQVGCASKTTVCMCK